MNGQPEKGRGAAANLEIFSFLGRPVRLGIGSGLNFCCVEKDRPRQDSLDVQQSGQET